MDVKCKDKTLNSTIYANRAQIQLCLKNYGKVIADCKKSIELQPNTYKSYWRAATALRALSKYTEGIEWCNNGLIIMEKLIENEKKNPTPMDKKDRKRNEDSDTSSEEEEEEEKNNKKKKVQKSELQKLNEQYLKLKQLKAKCVADYEKIQNKLKLKQEKELQLKMKEENERNTVTQKLKERGIKIVNEDKYNIMEAYGSKYKIEYDEKLNKLVFPVLFIYPEYDQSDFIKSFVENQHFIDHFKTMFAPESNAPCWDKKNKYLSHRLCVFYETKDRFINVNVNKSLKDIVERKDYIIPILPVFFILSKDSDFTSKFVKRKSDALLV